MQFTEKIHTAIKTASRWHDGQVRKGDGETPFVSHVFSVAFILTEYTDKEDIVIAALFHDVLEDISRSHADEIKNEFGDNVLQLVRDVSEDKDPETDKERPWRTRKEEYLAGLREHNLDALMISCADKLHNLLSLRVDVERHGRSEILAAFSSSAEERMWFYGEVLAIVEDRLDNPITDRLAEELEKTRSCVLE